MVLSLVYTDARPHHHPQLGSRFMPRSAPVPKILIVDDEATIRDVLRRYLEREGFKVIEAVNGPAALEAIEAELPDLAVLDLMLPGMDGLTLASRLRQQSQMPIVMLTAKGETADRIQGLETGADDYIVKPFSPREVVLRVKAVLRRQEPDLNEAAELVEINGLRLEPASRGVEVDGRSASLTAKEFDLLYFLMRHPRQVFSRDQLLDQVWGYDFFGDASTVTVHIRRLREKVEPDPSSPRRLVTVWGVGYKFDG
jgi:DNA-binding response OmpR family regulator